jgi:hypothetical protein
MSQPIAKWIPGRATYRRTASTSSPAERRVAAKAAAWQATPIAEFAEVIDGIQVRSLRPNKTGRKIQVRARVAGKAVSFSVFPYEGSSNDRRTFGSLLREVSILLLNKLSLQVTYDDGTRMGLLEAVSKKARLLAEIGLLPRTYVPHDLTESAVEARIREHVRRDGGLADLFRKVSDFVAKGSLDDNYDRHQSVRALDQFKTMALHALRHGARLDDMQTILDEAVVQVTLEC